MDTVKRYCSICYAIDGDNGNIEEWAICDICDEHYCEECSYTFGIHYQHQGARCYICADQSRRDPLSKEERRDRKANFIINI